MICPYQAEAELTRDNVFDSINFATNKKQCTERAAATMVAAARSVRLFINLRVRRLRRRTCVYYFLFPYETKAFRRRLL
jgi:hypothetical protein